MQEMWVRSLGWEDTLEKEMATHSSIFAWRIPWTEEPGGLYSPQGCKNELDVTGSLSMHALYNVGIIIIITNLPRITQLYLVPKTCFLL